MNIFELVNTTGNKINAMDINIPNSLDISFNDKSDTVTGMLTAIGIYPTTRTTLHGHLHKLFSAMIVMAYQGNETIDIPTIWSFLLLYLVLHSLRFWLTFFPLYISAVWVLLNTLKGFLVYAP